MTGTENAFPNVRVQWYMINTFGDTISAEEIDRVYVSELITKVCSVTYTQYLQVDDINIWKNVSSVSCEAYISIDGNGIINSTCGVSIDQDKLIGW